MLFLFTYPVQIFGMPKLELLQTMIIFDHAHRLSPCLELRIKSRENFVIQLGTYNDNVIAVFYDFLRAGGKLIVLQIQCDNLAGGWRKIVDRLMNLDRLGGPIFFRHKIICLWRKTVSFLNFADDFNEQ